MAEDIGTQATRDVKVLAPRLDTPSEAGASRRSASRLPEELAAEQLERLSLFAAIVGGLWTLGLLIDLVLVPIAWSTRVSARSVTLDLLGMTAAIWMFWYSAGTVPRILPRQRRR